MGRLRAAMQDRYKKRDEDVKIHTPRNLETLELTFRGERVAKVRMVGSLQLSHDLGYNFRPSGLWRRSHPNPTTSSPVCWFQKTTRTLF